MGILDDLRHKVEKLGDKAKEGLDDARDKAGDLLDDAKERFSSHDDERSPLSESADVGPDTASTDAVQPGYVAAEDDVTGSESDESSLTDDAADDADELDAGADAAAEEESFAAEPAAGPADDAPAPTPATPAAELDAEELVEQDDAATTETDGAEPADGEEPADEGEPSDRADETSAQEPVVETDVDPFDEPLTESIGDELAAAGLDPDVVAASVDDADRDPQS